MLINKKPKIRVYKNPQQFAGNYIKEKMGDGQGYRKNVRNPNINHSGCWSNFKCFFIPFHV